MQSSVVCGSTVNLLHLYPEPYVVNQSSRSGGCDLFKEQRQKVFVDFYQLLRDTRNRYLIRSDISSTVILTVRLTLSLGNCAQTSSLYLCITASGLNIFCSEDVWTGSWRTLHVQSW
jgi:hypothetical protein